MEAKVFTTEGSHVSGLPCLLWPFSCPLISFLVLSSILCLPYDHKAASYCASKGGVEVNDEKERCGYTYNWRNEICIRTSFLHQQDTSTSLYFMSYCMTNISLNVFLPLSFLQDICLTSCHWWIFWEEMFFLPSLQFNPLVFAQRICESPCGGKCNARSLRPLPAFQNYPSINGHIMVKHHPHALSGL